MVASPFVVPSRAGSCWAAVAALFLALSPIARAQSDQPRAKYGITAAGAFNRQTADFRALPGVPNCCPDFRTGGGLGGSLGIAAEWPIWNPLSLTLRASVAADGASLVASEPTTVSVGGNAAAGLFEHDVTASFVSIGIEPLLALRLIGPLSIVAGGRGAYAILSRFDQKEVITAPSGGTFPDGRRIRNDTSGNLPNATSFTAALLAGAQVSLPMNASGTLTLVPEVIASLGVTPIVRGLAWHTGAIRGGVSILFAPEHTAPEVAPPLPQPAVRSVPPPPPHPAPLPPAPTATLAAIGVALNGTEEPALRIIVEEFIATQMRPLLSYVFFDEGSAELQPRYKRLAHENARQFRAERLHNVPTLELYHDVLNIIGRRLFDHPRATVVITGCNDDLGMEHNNTSLSIRRAEIVADYFRDVWGIERARLRVEARTLPEKPSRMDDSDGIAENRRVEISSTTWEITEPVTTTDTALEVSPPILRFKPAATAPAGLVDWSVQGLQRDSILKSFTGHGTELAATIDWRFSEDDRAIPRRDTVLRGRLRVADSLNRQASAETSISVEQKTIERKRFERKDDKEIERFQLILFDYDRAELGSSNRRILDTIRSRIGRDATVDSVTGYTDWIGDPKHNLELSTARASSAAAALRLPTGSVAGFGRERPQTDNRLPEGRFYNRTVQIIVERPIQN